MNFEMPKPDVVTLELQRIATVLSVPDGVMARMRLDEMRDESLGRMVYQLSSYVAQNRQWEEVAEIPRKLTWRERWRCLWGGEIVTRLEYKAYRNCPHINAQPMRDHVSFMVRRGP